MSNKAANRTVGVTVAIIATLSISTVVAILNRERLATAYHSKFTFASHRKPMLDRLKDSESAKYRNEFIAGEFLCGEVNSKNSYGAYTGFTRYISSREGFTRLESDSPVFDELWKRLCRPQ